jgi:hypothetical protein
MEIISCMKKLIVILLLCLIPVTSFGLEVMGDKEMDKITGRFGASAAGDAGSLSAPASDAGFHAGNIAPAAEPASLVGAAISEGTYANDRGDDVTKMTTFFVNVNNVRIAATLGFF